MDVGGLKGAAQVCISVDVTPGKTQEELLGDIIVGDALPPDNFAAGSQRQNWIGALIRAIQAIRAEVTAPLRLPPAAGAARRPTRADLRGARRRLGPPPGADGRLLVRGAAADRAVFRPPRGAALADRRPGARPRRSSIISRARMPRGPARNATASTISGARGGSSISPRPRSRRGRGASRVSSMSRTSASWKIAVV